MIPPFCMLSVERQSIVGASIVCPHGTGYEFALVFGEYDTFCCRTSDARPYVCVWKLGEMAIDNNLSLQLRPEGVAIILQQGDEFFHTAVF